MENPHFIYGNKAGKQSDNNSGMNKTPSELENYRNFFKHITADHDVDMDLEVEVNTPTMQESLHG
jgi:hypothetical protein